MTVELQIQQLIMKKAQELPKLGYGCVYLSPNNLLEANGNRVEIQFQYGRVELERCSLQYQVMALAKWDLLLASIEQRQNDYQALLNKAQAILDKETK